MLNRRTINTSKLIFIILNYAYRQFINFNEPYENRKRLAFASLFYSSLKKYLPYSSGARTTATTL